MCLFVFVQLISTAYLAFVYSFWRGDFRPNKRIIEVFQDILVFLVERNSAHSIYVFMNDDCSS